MFLDSNPYSTRAQMIMILLAAMQELKGGRSKQEVIAEIEVRGWFDKGPDDNTPFPSAPSKEARWKTTVAFGRKDCYEEELFIRDEIRNSWQISKSGINSFIERKGLFASGQLDCRKCYMWSARFKQHIVSSYVPSKEDSDRPSNVYKDYHKRDVLEKVLDYAKRKADKEEST